MATLRLVHSLMYGKRASGRPTPDCVMAELAALEAELTATLTELGVPAAMLAPEVGREN